MTEPGREHAFVAGMVTIAKAVGAEVVAERVENEDEAETLAGLGVQYGQGWLFGRPALCPCWGSARRPEPARWRAGARACCERLDVGHLTRLCAQPGRDETHRSKADRTKPASIGL